MIEIDGSLGEGGGQILRSSLALSALTGQAVRLTRIRAGRPRPGLMRQHLAAVEAAAAVCGAETAGAALGSGELTFTPGTVRGGAYRFAIGSAGSTTLLLQTVLLPLLLRADAPAEVVIEGGTHNPYAPPFDFIERVYLPPLRGMGARVEVALERHGFYPAGGGRLRARIEPAARLTPLELTARGACLERRTEALSSAVRPSVGHDEANLVAQLLGWPAECAASRQVESPGPGNAAFAYVRFEHTAELFTAFGERGLSREAVARRVAEQAERFLGSGMPVGPHLADQLLLPLALAGGGRFRTPAPTKHTQTNCDVIQRFLPVRIRAAELTEGNVEIEVQS
jgi:RNA 3'-terminal phosphate cyclase (ATP)